MIRELPATGRFIVETTCDTYDVDVDARVAVYLDMVREAAGLHTEPEVFLFDTVECSVGEPMIFDVDTFPRSTADVVGIVPAPAEVTA